MNRTRAATASGRARQLLVLLAFTLLATTGCSVGDTTNNTSNTINGNCNGQGNSNSVNCPPAQSKAADGTSAGATAAAQPTKTQPTGPSSPPASAGVVSRKTYSTPEPFPLCDPSGAHWSLVNITPGSCGQNMAATVPGGGSSFATVTSFPNGVPLTSSNTVTVTGNIPNYPGISETGCLGPAEGSAASGYIALLCNNGQWSINSVVGLGTSGAVAGNPLATGTYPYNGSTSYDISLTFRAGSGKLIVTLTPGPGSSITRSFSTGQFTPVTVGYALKSSNNGSPGDAIATLGGFLYKVS
jgi:hypothetical protein